MADRRPAPLETAAGPAVVLSTFIAYALAGGLALMLAGPPSYASPLYPAAGIALAAVLVHGRVALLGVMLGALAISSGLASVRGGTGLASLVLPVVIALGATLQAAAAAALVRRHVSQPLVLDAPRDILRFSLLGAVVGCCVSASIATSALVLLGDMPLALAATTWSTWWVGDAFGVLIGAPLALTLIGRPRDDWRPRARTLAVPTLAAVALLAAAMYQLSELDRQRGLEAFERDADRLVATAEARLAVPVYALQALHSAALVQGQLDDASLASTTAWWVEQQHSPLRALGYSERVKLADLAAYEAAAKLELGNSFRVFDRDAGQARAADGEVVVLRRIAPLASNRAALGVNVLSIPAARQALQASLRSATPAATGGFRLTQAEGDETGVVLYQALFRGPHGSEAERRANFTGVVFVTVSTEQAMAGLAAAARTPLRWCLVDTTPGMERPRLAGAKGCEAAVPANDRPMARRGLALGGRTLELRIEPALGAPGAERAAAWLISMGGLAAASLLGALLLTVTGHTRRTERAVQAGTAELRREIRERAAAEAALRESEERLRSILDHVPLGVIFLDPQGLMIEGNARFAAMVGQRPAALRGVAVAAMVHADDIPRLVALRRTLFEGRGSQVVEPVRLLQAGGGELQVRVIANALRGADGRLLRMVGVVEDITEHLRLLASENALQRAEAANRAKSEFLSRMSHELRTPLNAMIGFAQLLGLDREHGLAEHQREWTQQIQRAGWHLLEMINETLDLARIESGAVKLQLAPLALEPLVAACSAMVAAPAAQRRLRLGHVLDPGARAVLADPMRLRQVLTNLLSNAVKYNVEGGAVSITAQRLNLPEGDMVELAVADTGLGMTGEQLGALFQPYNRLGREGSGIEGTGIGLVISRRLAELMGGTLTASSEAGRGSVFTLRLPAADADEAPRPVYSDTSPAPYQQRLVHYVEDNETNIEVMRGVLAQRVQIQLKTSQLGLDGLAAIRAQQPDLILLDMQLPDISGQELLRHLKQDDSVAHIPVVVVSADATTHAAAQALTAGAAHYVTKPLDVAQFLQIVDTLLESADTRWG